VLLFDDERPFFSMVALLFDSASAFFSSPVNCATCDSLLILYKSTALLATAFFVLSAIGLEITKY